MIGLLPTIKLIGDLTLEKGGWIAYATIHDRIVAHHVAM